MPGKKRILKALLFVGIGLFLLEGVLRVYNPFGFRVWGNRIVLPKNQVNEYRNTRIPKLGDTVITHTKNELGFRGPDKPSDWRDHLTVLVVGGSIVESYYLSDGKTWTAYLSSNLRNHFQRFWLNNAGFDGQSTFGHLILLKDHLIPLNPDVIVYLVGQNDVGKASPTKFDLNSIRSLSFRSVKAFVKSTADYSRVMALALNGYRQLQARFQEVGHSQLNLKEAENVEISDEEKEQLLQNHRKKYLPDFRNRVETLVSETRQAGIKPILMTTPYLFGEGTDPQTGVNLETISANKWNGRTWWQLLEEYNGVVREIGKRNDVPTVDFAHLMPKNSAYYYDPTHFTYEGARKAADVLDDRLCPILSDDFEDHLVTSCPTTD